MCVRAPVPPPACAAAPPLRAFLPWPVRVAAVVHGALVPVAREVAHQRSHDGPRCIIRGPGTPRKIQVAVVPIAVLIGAPSPGLEVAPASGNPMPKGALVAPSAYPLPVACAAGVVIGALVARPTHAVNVRGTARRKRRDKWPGLRSSPRRSLRSHRGRRLRGRFHLPRSGRSVCPLRALTAVRVHGSERGRGSSGGGTCRRLVVSRWLHREAQDQGRAAHGGQPPPKSAGLLELALVARACLPIAYCIEARRLRRWRHAARF